ncbi:uncharacterized protein EDB91DRAFT_73057 [Suillus paluster]|uniref:uncharacterized protein n=1 Tax=Suillus paluster TaxID=48578 RepID=UPI001B87B0EA|nr:uncharacterized protein EDB91DRAFT_73057 [Suillus paluster]KAG1747175.1 hypothetical protein EDB91DRAFT_73057 [Suillus paluster]
MCLALCFGVVHPSSRCQAVHICLPSLVHKALVMRSENASWFPFHMWGSSPALIGARVMRTFLLLPAATSAAGNECFWAVPGCCCTRGTSWLLGAAAAAACCWSQFVVRLDETEGSVPMTITPPLPIPNAFVPVPMHLCEFAYSAALAHLTEETTFIRY